RAEHRSFPPESWIPLLPATNPSNRQEDWEYVIGFCDQINKELEGPQIAVRLLAHKIQSPQEWEAVQALTVLEAGMKNCGRRFHSEVGKFRFLNELIKVVSPKVSPGWGGDPPPRGALGRPGRVSLLCGCRLSP
uniref:VHS domain-containing protein n=1 Tax=Ornithorhynchus anatinus TaxID=9258 RepID=A0A6I8P568_ORNAN